MVAGAEAGSQDSVGDRLAEQELLQRTSGIVEEIDRAVVALIAINPARLAIDGQSREQDVGLGIVFVRPIEHLEGVTRRDPALEIDVITKNSHEVVDALAREVVLQGRFVKAVIKLN